MNPTTGSLQTYNTIELRYADTELAKHQFVKECDFAGLEERVRQHYEEEIEILRAERSHWHHMYNNNVDERPEN